MRTFIALPLPTPIAQQLVRSLAPRHARIQAGVRWVPPENMHLTLRFLGETSNRQVFDLVSRLDQLQDLPAFDLSFSRFGVFPAWKSPNTIWLGFEKTSDLENLADTTESIVRTCDFPHENKPFTPHLTVARVKRNPQSNTVAQIKETFFDAPTPVNYGFQACHVVLFQSILSSEGAKYQAIHTVNLKQQRD